MNENRRRHMRAEILAMGLVVFAFALGLSYAANIRVVSAARDECVRGNLRTQPLYDFFKAGAEKVRGDARATTGADRQRLEEFALRFQRSADEILTAVPVRLRKSANSPQTVCDRAWPYPWPLN